MDIAHTSKISTLEVTVSQQAIQVKKLQQRIDELEYTDTDEVLMEANIPLEDEEMTKEDSLVNVRLKYKQEWESEDDIPYGHSIYKMIDDVLEWQLDNTSTEELEAFYRYHMQKHYEDKRNAIEFNDAWVVMHGIDDR